MARKQIQTEIAALERAEKTIYDYQRYHQHTEGVRLGLWQAEYSLYRKRKRLEKKLK